MYSGTTLRHDKGRVIGVHQKIDRTARRQIKRFIPLGVNFPDIKTILHFEGPNGPDGLHRKSPGVDEPCNFINPEDVDDKRILVDINDHLYNLSVAIRKNDEIRAGFEAAWAAHAIVDGLTPSHQYPFEDKVEELWGKPYDERSSVKDKNIIHGTDKRDTLAKNWEYWGAKGVMSTHFNFEIGSASAIAIEKFKKPVVKSTDIERLLASDFDTIFLSAVQLVYSHNIYDQFYKKGWTESLAREVRIFLVPEMIKIVTLAWYQSIADSQSEEGRCHLN